MPGVIKVQCRMCGHELTQPGGLMFSPPDTAGRVFKSHLCTICHNIIDEFIDNLAPLEAHLP